MGHKSASIAVIGAGWAGCAAATALAGAGHTVTLLEAARVAGGRARRVEQQGLCLDNGQHILLGAYRDTLQLMRTLGLAPDVLLLRLPLQMRYPAHTDGMDFIAPRLPAPLHMLWALIRARGLQAADKLALIRFSSAARWMDWRLNADCSVAQLLDNFGQTERLTILLWRPLCIAALNTPPERASANIFLHVLRDSLGAKRGASDMLLPRCDLSALLPEAAIRYIARHGGAVRYGTHVKRLAREAQTWRVQANDYTQQYDAVIIATPASVAADLLAEHDATLAAMHFDYEPITTCYLQYPTHVKLDQPFYALRDDPPSQQWGQFVFDRGQLAASQAGLLAVVISAASEAGAIRAAALAQAVASQLATVLMRPELATPLWQRVITEKRATFACTPDVARPPNTTAQPGLWLAGDYTKSHYPATLESAVRSGLQAAALCMASLP